MKLCLCVFIGLLLVFSYSNFQQKSNAKSEIWSEKKIDLKEALNGYWQSDTVEELIIGFRDKKLFVIREGNHQQVFAITEYKDVEVALCIQGHPFSLEVAIEGQKLKMNCLQNAPCNSLKLDNSSLFHKIEKMSQALEPQALVLGKDVQLSQKRIIEIQTQMASRHELDQGVRKKNPIDSKEMKRIDVDNTTYLIELVKEVGWIDKSRFGDKTSKTAFLIVQHSGNVPLMMAALPKLKDDGQLSIYALLYDRLQLMMGEKQLYGSQFFSSPENGLGVMPLEDPENVDKRRKEVGLEPLAQYAANFGLKEVKIFNWNCDK